ncbi:MAG: HD-GYP domain-containing protein [Terasakiella sp.]|uniref:HD-GYP domain-containing protein n=1 Tax=unclassified Terasakiella TaxID=2614952 RepID=UPI003AFFD9DF
MLSPQVAKAKVGYAVTDQSRRPGQVRALVVCKYEKFRSEIVSALDRSFEVDYYASPAAAMAGLMAAKTPGLIVMDYDLVIRGSRDFMRMKLESDHLRDIPFLITGRVPTETFNETVRMLCPVSYLRRPFMKSALHDEAGKLVDRLLEASWRSLPARQREALETSLGHFRGTTHRVRRGNPLNIHDTKECCFPLMEEVLDGQVADLIAHVKDHHNYTYVHCVKVSSLMCLMAHAIGISGHELLTVAAAGLLMDVGKLAVSQELLNSPDPLSRDELKQLKKHVIHSHDILNRSENISEGIRVIAEQHHEKLDGSGYPKGLTGRDLNELARLATIVDIFCALTDKRPYKPEFSCESAIKVLETLEGKVDPFLLALFKEIIMDVYRPENPSIH